MEQTGQPVTFTSSEGVQVAEVIDHMDSIKELELASRELRALFSALIGRVPRDEGERSG